MSPNERHEEHERKKKRRDELREKAKCEKGGHRPRMTPARAFVLGPTEGMIEYTEVSQEQRRFHVIRADAMFENERLEGKQRKQGDESTQRIGETTPDQKHVRERGDSEERIEE